MMARIAGWCYRRRRLVLLTWIVLLVGISVGGKAAGSSFSTSFSLPDTESERAFELLQTRFPARSGGTGQVVFTAADVRSDSVRAQMTGFFDELKTVPHVVGVTSPYDPQGARQVAGDGTVAYAEIQFDKNLGEVPRTVGTQITALGAKLQSPDLHVEFAGPIFGKFTPPASEVIGVFAAIVILLVAFGSVLAMGLPIMTALFGIGVGIGLITLLTHVLSVPDFATQIAAMISIGVGIDYALFIVTRYRSGLHDGLDPEHAVVLALSTAGRAVVFAGCTVVISLLGLFLMGLGFVRGMAVGASCAVLITMLASITLLPAVLGFVGRTIDRLGVPHRKKTSDRPAFWVRWSHLVQRRPWTALAVGLVPLVLMAMPAFSIRLGASDAGNNATSDTTRRAYDLLSKGFGPGFNGPLLIAATLPPGAGPQVLQPLVDTLKNTPGVAFASAPVPNPAGDAAIVQVVPTTSPQDEATSQLIERLRTKVVPDALRGSGVTAYIGGQTAIFDDLADYLGKRLPLFFGAVLLLSFLLLMAVFRSLLVPLKAVVMNLLSIGASYGAIVAIFQWGWLKSLVGLGKGGPIEAWAPMMLFAIVFGLSMDYEVFLLSRIKEEHDRTGDNATAVADGLAATARVITAAALIMVSVFASFVLGDNRVIKLIGLGLALAVLIDATLVRMVLVPATMELLGERNWWFPKWLERVVPRLTVEVEHIDEAA